MPSNAGRSDSTYVESLNLLAVNELALESLYREYARQHANKAAFWQEFAADEHRHATWVTRLAAQVKQDAAPQGRFKIEAIRAFTQYVNDQEIAAKGGEVTFGDALIIASYIEDALIERKFFEQLPMDDSHLKKTLTSLQRATEKHSKMIKDARAQFQPH